MRTIKRDIVAAVITSRDSKLFMGKKDPAKGGVYTDCWHIPGGGIEEGEDHTTALHREILEETGINTNTAIVWLIDNNGAGTTPKTLSSGEKVMVEMKFSVYGVHVDMDADEIEYHLDDDLIEGGWFTERDIANLKLTPPSIALFQRVKFAELLQLPRAKGADNYH